MAAKIVAKKVVQLAEIPAFGASKVASKISVFDGGIETLGVQCVVNDVDSDLSKPKGVTTILNKAGGHGLINDYSRLRKCPVGSVVIGRGFDLPCEWVIHTCSPTVSYQRIHANEEEEAQLRSCYASALSLCTEKNIRSVAFPSLGTRSHRYPLSEAAKVGVKAVVDMLKEKGDSFDRVVLCTHNGKDTEVIKKTLEEYLKDVE
ncbi:O-acetyl-ADP-ribose deacetylase MACROD1 [Blastocystis sp. ATCC 50177/Nand II]|uniref:O-acetyl-ADP-ribose deacetylase MACROD1 n=1 Tax=Blastocystis sp. subtype 1 (strain ATCC 50177 / NandII) TaxID=478820 RepID=A0A196S7V6_BLAHN|nr:O-acetyl-ADP-ribose deacetylase MACROD1 [Blastocystis sp. ATCC 50177/Nand II]